MPQVKPTEKIRAAAYYFVFVSRNIKKIASDFGVVERTIRKWEKLDEWTQVLDACDYQGPRTFEVQPYRNTERDAGEDFRKAREVYLEAQEAGEPRHTLARLTEERTGINRKKVGEWARKYGWRD